MTNMTPFLKYIDELPSSFIANMSFFLALVGSMVWNPLRMLKVRGSILGDTGSFATDV